MTDFSKLLSPLVKTGLSLLSRTRHPKVFSWRVNFYSFFVWKAVEVAVSVSEFFDNVSKSLA